MIMMMMMMIIVVAECSAHTVPLQRFSVSLTATRAGRVFTEADD